MAKKYIMHYGIIRNDESIITRDQGTFKKDSIEEIKKALASEATFLKTIGYKIHWTSEIEEVEEDSANDHQT